MLSAVIAWQLCLPSLSGSYLERALEFKAAGNLYQARARAMSTVLPATNHLSST